MSPLIRKIVGLTLGCAISALLLFYLLREVKYEELKASLLSCDFSYLPLMAFLFFAALYVRAYRWKFLLPNKEELSTSSLYKATLIGGLAVWLLPLRAGELVRPWVCAKLQPVGYSSALASAVTERIFDLATLLVVLGFCVSFYESVPDFVSIGARMLGTVAVLGIVVMVLCYLYSENLIKIGKSIISVLSRKSFPQVAQFLDGLLEEFVHGVRSIGSLKELFLVISTSFGFWVVISGMYYIGMLMFGLPGGILMGFTLCTMIGVAIAAPSAPGFIGVFQFGCTLALTNIGGVAKADSISYSIVMHVSQVLLCFFGALIALRSEGLNFDLVFGKHEKANS